MKSRQTISEVLKKYNKIEIELLLSHVLGKSKEFLFMESANQLSANQLISIQQMVKRRLHGEPMAYILGYKDFYGLRFMVNRDVLIPRPETERIVESVKLKVESAGRKMKILDVGTGSGCIAISLAKEFPISNNQFPITASDISDKALAVARQNAKMHHAKIKFIKSDLLKSIKGDFDIIIGNLPYVPLKNYELRIKNLEWEPKIALTDGTDKFVIYERFFQQVRDRLSAKGTIYLEIDPKTKAYIAKWTKQYLPKSEVKFYRDLNHLWRYVEIKAP